MLFACVQLCLAGQCRRHGVSFGHNLQDVALLHGEWLGSGTGLDNLDKIGVIGECMARILRWIVVVEGGVVEQNVVAGMAHDERRATLAAVVFAVRHRWTAVGEGAGYAMVQVHAFGRQGA